MLARALLVCRNKDEMHSKDLKLGQNPKLIFTIYIFQVQLKYLFLKFYRKIDIPLNAFLADDYLLWTGNVKETLPGRL